MFYVFLVKYTSTLDLTLGLKCLFSALCLKVFTSILGAPCGNHDPFYTYSPNAAGKQHITQIFMAKWWNVIDY